MKFIPDRSNCFDNGSTKYYYEQLDKFRQNYVNKDNRLDLITNQLSQFGRELGSIKTAINEAFEHYGMDSVLTVTLMAQLSELCDMLDVQDLHSNRVLDANKFEQTLRTGRQVTYGTRFDKRHVTLNMPVFVMGISLSFEQLMIMIDEMKDLVNSFTELLNEFVNETWCLAA